tara:strand:- start:296 stop:706 length:411 start_codon:yes stop_codon:yes gene_type:complete
MENGKYDAGDYIIGGLPQDCSKEIYEEQYLCDFSEDYEWLTFCTSLVTKHSAPKYLSQSVMLHFLTVEYITKETDIKAGAILLKLTDLSTGEVVDKWVPKKLAANIDPVARTIWVWDVFAQQHLSEFYGEQDETPE